MIPRIINDNIVVQTDTPGQLRALFPAVKEGKVKGQNFCAVPFTLESARVLNNIGIKVPSPIRSKYSWPGRFTPRWYQEDTAEFFTLNARSHCHNAPRCVDASTEFLTPTGWKRIDEYEEGDKVAQWLQLTDKAEFVTPTEYIDMPCDEMYHLKTAKGLDQMLTENHRVPYFKRATGLLAETTAAKMYDADRKLKAGWQDGLPVTFLAPDRKGIHLSAVNIRVMVAVIADGWFSCMSTKRCVVKVKKNRKKIRMRELLRNADIKYTESQKDYLTAKDYSVFTFYAPRREKEFTTFWWDATESQLKIIIDEVRYWDSSDRRSSAFAFSTFVERSAEFIQYAAVATKRVASLHCQTRERRGAVEKEYVVYVRGNGNPLRIRGGLTKKSNIAKVKAPGGRCYCFSVPSTYLILRRNGCVFVTGNTGKTNSALWAADYLKKIGQVNRVLVVAPLSTLWDVWQQAIFESFPLITFAVLHGSRQKRLELLKQKHDYYIINHHGVALIEKDLRSREDIDLVIVDESAVFRNARAKTLFKPLDRVLNKQGIVRSAWGLTGTPTPNDPTDAFGQCKLLTPEKYRGHFTSFKRETMIQIAQFNWVPKKGHEASVSRILKPSIRFERSVCTDMEPCFIERRAQLSAEQQKAYKQLVNIAATEIQGSTVTAVNAAVLISKLVQTACGCVIDADGAIVKMDYGPRLAVLEELIEGNNEKVLVFVPFTGVLNDLAAKLRKRWSVAIVDGSVSARNRTQIFKDFRTLKDPHILVCHPQVMAHGLDLTAATLSIWYAPIHKAEIYQQANARTDGSKQQVKIDIANIYATAEEKRIYTVLKEKGRLQDIVLELSKGGVR